MIDNNVSLLGATVCNIKTVKRIGDGVEIALNNPSHIGIFWDNCNYDLRDAVGNKVASGSIAEAGTIMESSIRIDSVTKNAKDIVISVAAASGKVVEVPYVI